MSFRAQMYYVKYKTVKTTKRKTALKIHHSQIKFLVHGLFSLPQVFLCLYGDNGITL